MIIIWFLQRINLIKIKWMERNVDRLSLGVILNDHFQGQKWDMGAAMEMFNSL